MDEFTRLIHARNGIRYCESCGKKMSYAAVHGVYSCKQCGINIKDTYGKMKEILEASPNLSMSELSMILGIPLREIRIYIHDGVLENPKMDQEA